MKMINAREVGGARPIPEAINTKIPEVTQKVDMSKRPERQAFDPETGLTVEGRKELDAWEPVIEGGEPVLGGWELKDGKEVPKDPPEDVKIKDPRNRLFAVFDGVSSGGRGALAARLSGKIISERLGDNFERELANIRGNAKLTADDRKKKIEIYAMVAIRTAIREAHEACERIPGGSTTASVTKLVEMPNGSTQMFYANVGDSRIYLQSEDGELEQLSVDDGMLAKEVRQGRMTKKQAVRIDQALGLDELAKDKELNDDQREVFLHRNVVTESVGSSRSRKPLEMPVQSRTLKPGQRIVITSDGVHDVVRKADMEGKALKALKTDETYKWATDARQAEKLLQKMAEGWNRDPSYGRRKWISPEKMYMDDTSAVVYEVPATLPVREEPKEEKTEVRTLGWGDVRTWRDDLKQRMVKIFELERMAKKLGATGSVRIRKEMLDQKIVAAELERNMRELELGLLRKEIPKSVRPERGSALEEKALAAKGHKEFLDRFPVYLEGLQSQRQALEKSPMDPKTEDINKAVEQARLQAHLRAVR